MQSEEERLERAAGSEGGYEGGDGELCVTWVLAGIGANDDTRDKLSYGLIVHQWKGSPFIKEPLNRVIPSDIAEGRLSWSGHLGSRSSRCSRC